MDFSYIKRNLDEVIEAAERASLRVGSPLPKLVSVTKSGSDEELLALAAFGAPAIGENRPGELKRRGELLASNGFAPELHEIGTLQSNKAKLVCPIATLIHSLDSLSLAKEISRQGTLLGRDIDVLIEINSASEEQKGGILPTDAERFMEDVLAFGNIKVRGLMTMGPVCDNPEDLRPYFRKTKELFDKFNTRYGFGDDPVLSMGMSESFEVAIEEGSTLVRVGRRLFKK
jgi:pyridoxal phosphate enzyme (YggS family)